MAIAKTRQLCWLRSCAAVGLDAHLALLRAGEPSDIDPQLPGFGLFDHAIVFIGGKQQLWIDATAENARIGTLPLEDQGKHALVIDASSMALVTTPESTAVDNRIIHRVDIQLKENGNGDIRETAEAYGSLELVMRSVFGGDDHQLRAALERFAKNSFGAKTLGAFSVTHKGDFSQPFRVSIEARDSSAASTRLDQAIVRLSNALLFEELPYLLRASGNQLAEEKSRQHDFVLREPYHAEVHFNISAPPGFKANQVPPSQTSRADGASYTAAVRRSSDGAIQIDYEFEIQKRRWTPTEFERLRAQMRKLSGGGVQLVVFSHTAADLVAVGKTADALRLAREDALQHPASALAQMRFAQLLMNSGAGAAAIEAAKKAVALDSHLSPAWLTLGYAYEHDSFGRLRAGDWNPVEAEKVLRKAIELDQSDLEPQMELAIVLEHNSAGERYSGGARLTESVTLYRQLLIKGPNPVIMQNLVVALMHLGRYREAQEELDSLAGQAAHPVFSIALTALTDSPDAAIIKSQNAPADEAVRAQQLAAAAITLAELREYNAAHPLLEAAQRIGYTQVFLQNVAQFTRCKRYEKVLLPDDDPQSVVQRFLVLAARTSSSREELAALLSKHADAPHWQARLQHVRAQLAFLHTVMRTTGGSSDAIADLILNYSKLQTAGADPAQSSTPSSNPPLAAKSSRVTTTYVRAVPVPSAPVYVVTMMGQVKTGLVMFFVVREDGHSRLLATGDGLESIGRIALDALAKGDLTRAQQWLDSAKDRALPESTREDKGPAFRYLWAGTAPETRNAVWARAAAASLIGTYTGSPEAISILKQIFEHPAPYMDREDITFALCETLRKAQRWRELRDYSQTLLKSRSYQAPAFRFLGEALVALQQWADLAKAADARLATKTKEKAAYQFAAIAAMGRGDFNSAGKSLELARNAFYASIAPEKILEAWNAILARKVSDDLFAGIDLNNQSNLMSEGPEYAYTFAYAQLLNGKPEECKRTLYSGLTADRPDAAGLAWFVLAELMNSYSLPEAAASAFEHARSLGATKDLDFAKLLFCGDTAHDTDLR